MQGKKPTRKQGEIIADHRLNYNNWLVLKDTASEMVIKHKDSGKERVIKK